MSPDRIVRLNKDPIVDSVCEARFAAGAIRLSVLLPGLLAKEFKGEIKSIDETAIASLPDEIARIEPSIPFTPRHRIISHEGWIVNIADRALSVGYSGKYPGWGKFKPIIERVFATVFQSGMVPSVERISVKYINFFGSLPKDISEILKLSVNLGDESATRQPLQIRTEIRNAGLISVVQILHPANLRTDTNSLVHSHGLILDIDTIKPGSLNDVKDNFLNYVQEVRDEEKRVFFNLLTKTTLESCEPVYE